MTSRTGMCMHSSTEGVCENDAVQFQSCDGSSYCTELEENGCTDVSRQLQDSCSYQIPTSSDVSFTVARNRLLVARFTESVCKMDAKAADR